MPGFELNIFGPGLPSTGTNPPPLGHLAFPVMLQFLSAFLRKMYCYRYLLSIETLVARLKE